MGKRKRLISEKSIKKHIAQGRGSGRLDDYNPWLHIQDVASLGLVTRIRGWKSGRVHHLLSLLELRYFFILDWSSEVLDVREQYSLLPLEETLAIAEACGVKHPKDPRTKQPIVMTTDFVVTISVDGKDVDQARTVKYAGDLNSQRVLEKLEIERRYWEARNVDWKIVTEQQVSKVLARNVEWVHPYRILEEFSTLPETVAAKVIAALTRAVSLKNRPLRDITFETDRRLRLEAGTSLSLVRYLIATRLWLVDMRKPLRPGNRLVLLSDSGS
jgi:hypothetical protein